MLQGPHNIYLFIHRGKEPSDPIPPVFELFKERLVIECNLPLRGWLAKISGSSSSSLGLVHEYDMCGHPRSRSAGADQHCLFEPLPRVDDGPPDTLRLDAQRRPYHGDAGCRQPRRAGKTTTVHFILGLTIFGSFLRCFCVCAMFSSRNVCATVQCFQYLSLFFFLRLCK